MCELSIGHWRQGLNNEVSRLFGVIELILEDDSATTAADQATAKTCFNPQNTRLLNW